MGLVVKPGRKVCVCVCMHMGAREVGDVGRKVTSNAESEKEQILSELLRGVCFHVEVRKLVKHPLFPPWEATRYSYHSQTGLGRG